MNGGGDFLSDDLKNFTHFYPLGWVKTHKNALLTFLQSQKTEK